MKRKFWLSVFFFAAAAVFGWDAVSTGDKWAWLMFLGSLMFGITNAIEYWEGRT